MRPLLLLHGAIGAKDQFNALADKLKEHFDVHTMNFSGHGDAETTGVFSIENFADDVLHYLSANQIETVDIFGYSMGGYVALYLAKNYPGKIGKIFTLATKFEWTPEIAARETKMLNAEKIAEKIPAFAQQLEKRHANDWKAVLSKTAAMMVSLGNRNPLAVTDYATIGNPVLVGIGDKDQMVTLEETINAYRNLASANLIVFPNTQHPIEKVDVNRLAGEIRAFFG